MNQAENRYAIVVVTYCPDEDDIRYMDSLCTQHDDVYIVDNTPADSATAIPACRHLTHNGENIGLSAALNLGIHQAGRDGADDIFLFDQDSRIDAGYFSRMLEFKHQATHSTADFYAPDFLDINAGTHAKFAILRRWLWTTKRCGELTDHEGNTIVSSFAITSGLLISYSTFLELGDIREDYFIDHMDTEYCMRALCAGRKILINCDELIRHQIGNRDLHRLLGVTFKPNNHRAIRRYYISRNGMDIVIRYFLHYPSVLTLHIARTIHDLVAVTLYEDQKLRKLFAIVLGNLHACIRRSGEYRNDYFP